MLLNIGKAGIIAVILISAPLFAQTELDYSIMVAEGDSLYHLFDNQAAQVKYFEALESDPGNCEILWRLSRTYVDIGEHLEKDAQEPYFIDAVAYADSAIIADSTNASAHLRRAIALGKLALHKGVFKSVSLVKKVRGSLEKSLELNPEEPTAHYVLGRTHHKLCEKAKIARGILGLGWANREIAQAEYEKAIEIDGTFIMYHLDYAKLLMKIKEYDSAKAELELIAELPIRDEDDEDFKKEAEELLTDKHFQ